MTSALFVAFRSGDEEDGRWTPVGKLEHEGGVYRFWYTKGSKRGDFTPLAGMPDLGGVYESEELFPVFANRLLAKSRPEYEAFLRWGGFEPDQPLDPIMELGVTEGRRVTDSLEIFPCPEPNAEDMYVNKFFLHGVRWMDSAGLERINRLLSGEPLSLSPEPTNEDDSNAVAVFSATDLEGVKVGYVPRYLARDVNQLKGACHPDITSLTVQRLNSDAPLQQRVLCRMKACWPPEFQPCAGEEYQPIVEHSTLATA